MTLSVDDIRKQLTDEFDLGALSEEKRTEMLDMMVETVMKEIVLSIGEKIGDDGADEFEKLLDSDTPPEELEAFIKRYVPDPNAFVAGVIADFKKKMKEGI